MSVFEKFENPQNFDQLNGQQIQALLSLWLQNYHDRKLYQQFPVKIPKGMLPRINEYRDGYFSYLKDSVYKSNICYLLQQVDFQLWLYRLFKPELSLANAFFFQLMVNLGVICEALVTAILLDPIIEIHIKDRSLGDVATENLALKNAIINNELKKNLLWLKNSNALPSTVIEALEEIRQMRNTVHIQNWEGRIYEKIDFNYFRQRLEKFQDLLRDLNRNPPDYHKLSQLAQGGTFEIGEVKSKIRGKVSNYIREKRHGFIISEQIPQKIFFHLSKCNISIVDLKSGLDVDIDVKRNEKGLEAIRVDLYEPAVI